MIRPLPEDIRQFIAHIEAELMDERALQTMAALSGSFPVGMVGLEDGRYGLDLVVRFDGPLEVV